METANPDVSGFPNIVDDDIESVVSYDDIAPISPLPMPTINKFPPPPPPPDFRVLKIDGKIPDVLFVLKYIGWSDRIVGYRQSNQQFKDIPEHGQDDVEVEQDQDGKEKPVIEIITKVFTNEAPRRSPRRRRVAPPGQQDRPITETFDQVDCRYDDYYSDDEELPEVAAPNVTRPSMLIHSAHLINALKAVVSYYPYINLEGKSIGISSPYRVLYHHRQALAKYRDNQPSTHDTDYAAVTASHIDVLLKFLDDNLGQEIRQEEERHKLKTPKATFDLFWLLLKPGEIVYAKRYDIWTPFVVSDVRINQNPNDLSDVYKVNCWMIESNGFKVNRFMFSINVSPWLGERFISALPVIPAAFWPEDLEAQGGLTMRERCYEYGKMYWELLKQPTYMEYDGQLVNSGSVNRRARGPTGFMRGRVVCDVAGFDEFFLHGPESLRSMPPRYPRASRSNLAPPPSRDYLPMDLPQCGCPACQTNRPAQRDSIFVGFEDLDPTKDTPPDNELFYIVCSKTIPGFILGDRRWGHLDITRLADIEPNRDAFNHLVLDEEIKLTTKALIGKFATNLESGEISPWGNDFVKNKGEGRIFLLHGAPGVGKTCTAECIAELTNRPLISLTSGDLSLDSYSVETNLAYFLELGQRYGALILLDEADVYLERRRSKDISRNGLVSVFLRALEYYRGILFLTTNRVQSFDPAFMSRIHVALHYDDLRDEDRERIWVRNFDRLARDSNGRVHVSKAASDYVWNSQDVKDVKWNGREIRNAMQTALALAESEAQEQNTNRITIAEKHLRAVVKMSRGFKDYMKKTASVEGFGDTLQDSDDEYEVDDRRR